MAARMHLLPPDLMMGFKLSSSIPLQHRVHHQHHLVMTMLIPPLPSSDPLLSPAMLSP
ncbi:hypothetical protein [Synechococcus sp. MIT S1220]|uniref:hypothetical protein n=1 Tax=Synechococcus sp. MIT S1220 TaxID=3082549 RepID=UPI0039B0346F